MNPQVQTPQTPIDPRMKASVDEAFRRKAGLGASSTAIGADKANSLNPENPIANSGTTTTQPPMQGGAAGNPSAGTIAGMKTQKSEAKTLIDAMIYRMKKLTERGE